VVVRTSLLQIFSVVNVSAEFNDGKIESRVSRLDQSTDARLHLLAEHHLPGTVTGISRVKILNSKSGGEAILFAFRNAKLSLVEWDPERYGISTISIHYYERDDLARSPWIPDLSSCPSLLTVDPSSRCAILNFGLRNLAILPFHQAGDDLVMIDYGHDLVEEQSLYERGDSTSLARDDEKENPVYQTPYASSFVLPLTALDPSLLHPISLAFLYEYREPTFGILYSQVATSSALLYERKDVSFYSVFTLDLEQRASTTLLSVSRLPSDLLKVVALPPPVGGALLIGSNELVHVDQAGKTNAVGVNEFARVVSSFSMADQSDLALRLEGSVIEQLDTDTGDLILVLLSGDMVLVSFKLDGRSVSGLSLYPVPAHAGGNILRAGVSCSAAFGSGKIFFGSEDTDSVLVGWVPTLPSTKRTRGHAAKNADDLVELSDMSEDQDDDDTYEDDLYSAASNVLSQDYRPSIENPVSGGYAFQVYDTLLNIAPLRDIALGTPCGNTGSSDRGICGVRAALELVGSYGSDKGGGLVMLQREIDPVVANSIEVSGTEAVWSVSVNSAKTKALEINGLPPKKSEHYVIISRAKSIDREESIVRAVITGNNLEPFNAPEFNPNEDITVDVGTLAKGTRVVQVLKGEIRIYDNSEFAAMLCVFIRPTADSLQRAWISTDLPPMGRGHQ
jgi:cleavage and polyadenylation specificity factor subunit 1